MLHIFNPGHEYALLNESVHYTPRANMLTMQQELAYLSAWYASPDDYVLINESLSSDFKLFIENNLPQMAEGIVQSNIGAKHKELEGEEVELWGISAQGVHLCEILNRNYELSLVPPIFKSEFVALSGRQTAQKCLTKLVERCPAISKDLIPVFYSKLEGVASAVENSSSRLLAKAPFSSAGKGLLWLPALSLTRTENQILNGILKKQGSVSVENALNKQLDFAMEFKIDASGTHFLAYSLFKTNPKGAYQCNYLASQQRIESKIGEYIELSLLSNIKSHLINILQEEFASVYTKGYIGVDMLVYEENGAFFLHPCVEINMRNNMGIVSMNLSERFLHPDSEGYFYIDFSAKGEIYEQHLEDLTFNPANFVDKKLRSGYLPLCPVTETSKYRAYMKVDVLV